MRIYFYIFYTSIFLFTGCSSLFTIQTKSNIKANSPDEKIEVYNVAKDEFETIGQGEGHYKLNNHNDYYLFKTSKKGKIYSTTPQTRTKFNALKLIDIAIPLIADIILVKGFASNNDEENKLIGPAWVVGTLGWVSLGFSPWKKYEKQINLPPLPPLPDPQNDLASIVVTKVSANVLSKNYNTFYYNNVKDFFKHKESFKSNHKESIIEKDLNLNDNLNDYLSQWGFRDSTSNKLISDFFDSYRLSCEIVAIENYKVGQLLKTDFKSNWSISIPNRKKPIFTKEISSTSNWVIQKEGGFIMAFQDALISNIRDVLMDEEFIVNLKASEMKTRYKNINADTILIPTPLTSTTSIEEAVKSVVTVQTDNGHGSGCIISNNGYIITNYHVISDTSKLKMIILTDGTKIPFKVVRVNEEYDLALLKIDTNINLTAFKINLNINANIGKEVYAIGTPSDIELGQTLSKGIISGKRLFNQKQYIQTDVSINSGNSGGALIDPQGNLLGIISAKIVGVGIEGLGFAIPIKYINESLVVFTK